jgi:hypothetical protein
LIADFFLVLPKARELVAQASKATAKKTPTE